jgi:hypothetical protein
MLPDTKHYVKNNVKDRVSNVYGKENQEKDQETFNATFSKGGA